ncbi:MAG: hypothetical protein ACRDAO_04690 [Culicoidibacterales bacterium]
MKTIETVFHEIDGHIQPEANYLAQLPQAIQALDKNTIPFLRQAVAMATMKGIGNFRSDVLLPEGIILLVVAIIQSLNQGKNIDVLELDASIGTMSLAIAEQLPKTTFSYMEVEPILQAIFEATAAKLETKIQAVELDELQAKYDCVLQNVDMETAAKNWQQLAREYAELLPELLREDGQIVLIMPQIIFNEAIFSPLREAMFDTFHLQAYIQLPHSFFVAEDLAKVIVILTTKQLKKQLEPVVLQLPDPKNQQLFSKAVRDLLQLLAQTK